MRKVVDPLRRKQAVANAACDSEKADAGCDTNGIKREIHRAQLVWCSGSGRSKEAIENDIASTKRRISYVSGLINPIPSNAPTY